MNDAPTFRMVDACLNRAREAARTIEDTVRFTLDSPRLSALAKTMRHDLTALVRAAGLLDPLPLARNTPGDVGRHIKAPEEFSRPTTDDVLRANLKRLQEALRSLEEAAKQLGKPDLAAGFEALRYRAYILETDILGHAHRRRLLADRRLMVLVTESLCRRDVVDTVRDAVAGGADVIQIREKTMTDRRLVDRARRLLEITHPAGALLIVNDRPHVARAATADGVHLGADDLLPSDVRPMLGADCVVGQTVHNLDEARQAIEQSPDYIGVGPLFETSTKEVGLPAAGPRFVETIREVTGAMPVFGIGGIALDNIAEATAAGLRRVAVCGAVIGAADPGAAAARICEALDGG